MRLVLGFIRALGKRVRIVRLLAVGVLVGFIGAIAGYVLVLRPRIRGWGRDPYEADQALPGDDLVGDPSAVETRGLTINAPLAKVWPWLVQMGFGRAGWYSYDALDNRGPSADTILPDFQHPAVGEIMPTHPGGGFLVKVVDKPRALVLYIDTDVVRQQAEQAQADGKTESTPMGLRASGGMFGTSFPEFAASWAFYLEPIDDDRTRLIERFRARTPGNGPASAVLGEIMGTGIVLMTRKQMLGIKQRAEAAETPAVEATTPVVEETEAQPVGAGAD